MSVKHALLGLLEQRPRHGYELRAAFEAMVGGEQIWDLKPAQIYATLTRLADSGLVVMEGTAQAAGPEKRNYAITDAGRRQLGDWFEQAVQPEHQRDEFFLKLVLAMATGGADPHRVIYVQRGGLYRELHEMSVRRAQADPHRELVHILLLDQAIMRLEADLRWLDMAEARLDEIQRQPLPAPEVRPRGRPKTRPQ